MRTRARVDANQNSIVGALRSMGASVQHLHMVGKGCPDILVGYKGVNYAIEIKDGSKPPSARDLSDDEKSWHAAWRGHVAIAENIQQAMEIVGIKQK